MIYLSDFHILRPPYETPQENTLKWLIEAHIEAEKQAGLPLEELDTFRNTITEKFWRVGCKPEAIAKRGHIVADYLHLNWQDMKIYALQKKPGGVGLKERTEQFSAHADQVLEMFYTLEKLPPNEIIHVTCTGYVSPSAVQKLIAKRNWGRSTTSTHAYHMGCYGSIPAIRMAKGALLSNPESTKTDIVHTEICSLHANPSLHRLDQLVSQSLFADGFIKYSARAHPQDSCLAVLKTKEELIPDSSKAMTWDVADWGFEMSLAKEIPVLIARALKGYLERLLKEDCEEICRKAVFAIHPGGPKILSNVCDILSLSDNQIAHSTHVLREFGNMSSATLPHIWKAILDDPAIDSGTQVISLAFGPGLTLCGALMEKRCG